jgi:hypothetical protein
MNKMLKLAGVAAAAYMMHRLFDPSKRPSSTGTAGLGQEFPSQVLPNMVIGMGPQIVPSGTFDIGAQFPLTGEAVMGINPETGAPQWNRTIPVAQMMENDQYWTDVRDEIFPQFPKWDVRRERERREQLLRDTGASGAMRTSLDFTPEQGVALGEGWVVTNMFGLSGLGELDQNTQSLLDAVARAGEGQKAAVAQANQEKAFGGPAKTSTRSFPGTRPGGWDPLGPSSSIEAKTGMTRLDPLSQRMAELIKKVGGETRPETKITKGLYPFSGESMWDAGGANAWEQNRLWNQGGMTDKQLTDQKLKSIGYSGHKGGIIRVKGSYATGRKPWQTSGLPSLEPRIYEYDDAYVYVAGGSFRKIMKPESQFGAGVPTGAGPDYWAMYDAWLKGQPYGARTRLKQASWEGEDPSAPVAGPDWGGGDGLQFSFKFDGGQATPAVMSPFAYWEPFPVARARIFDAGQGPSVGKEGPFQELF